MHMPTEHNLHKAVCRFWEWSVEQDVSSYTLDVELAIDSFVEESSIDNLTVSNVLAEYLNNNRDPDNMFELMMNLHPNTANSFIDEFIVGILDEYSEKVVANKETTKLSLELISTDELMAEIARRIDKS